MLMNRSLRLAALLSVSLGLAPAALAAAETPQYDKPYVFETVDSFLITSPSRFEVTGLIQGENTVRTVYFFTTWSASSDSNLYLTRCDRMALVAMSKPGLYFFEVVQKSVSISPSCRLTRR